MASLKLATINVLLLTTLIISACSSPTNLNDVTNLIPGAYQGLSVGGIGNPNMTVQLDTVLPNAVEQLIVYQIQAVDENLAISIAKDCGLMGDLPAPTSNSGHFFFVDDEQVLELYSTGRIELHSQERNYSTPASFPTEKECISIAKDWLQYIGLYPENIIRIETKIGSTIAVAKKGSPATESFPTSLLVKFITGINGYEIEISGASVRLGDQAKVMDTHAFQPSLIEYGTVNVRTPAEALDILKNRLVNPSFDITTEEQVKYNCFGERLVIHNVSLKYTNIQNSPYLQPIYVFEGEMFSNHDDIIGESFVGCVDAINH